MKAVQIAEPFGLDHLPVVEMDDPGAPGAGQIRVRVQASSLNYHDMSVVLGIMKAPAGRIPLSDCGGVVEAVGEGVKDFAAGDLVVSTFFPQWLAGDAPIGDFSTSPGDGIDGFAREVVVAPATSFTKAPKGYSAAEAATLTTAGLTAWRSLIVNGKLKAGDSVLILGTGGVSIFALQIAKAMGAVTIVTSSSNEKLARAKALGADHAINYRSNEKWAKTVSDITSGRGVDHIVEVGGAGTLSQSIRAIRVGGHISLIGVLAGVQGPIPTAALMAKQARLEGLIVASRQHQIEMVKGFETIGLKPVIDQSFALEDLGAAFAVMQKGGHFGKIAITL